MKVVAVLACRLDSVRLYGKPMQLIGDKPIIVHLTDQLNTIKSLNEIVFAISEQPENSVFEKFGIKYIYGDENDVLSRLIKAGEHAKADIILRATPECPYIYIENIEEMIKKHIEEKADLTICEKLPEGAYIELINLSALQKSHKEGEDRHRSELCTLYINENPDKFKTLKLLPPKELQRPDIRITVDNPEDLIVVREIYNALGGEGKIIKIKDIIKFLDKHPKIKAINQHIEAGKGRVWD